MIKAAIFDMDGLLIDSEPLWHKVSSGIYRKLGVILDEVDHLRMMGRTLQENTEYLYRIHQWDEHTTEEVSQMIVDGMVAAIRANMKLMPGADKVLKMCRQAHLRVALASGSYQVIIDAVVDKLEIRENFDHLYSAQYEQYGKPHPGVFLKAADTIGVSPEDCVVFEDSPSGVLAAKSAKMYCISVPDEANRDNKFIQTADIILESLNDFNLAMLDTLVS